MYRYRKARRRISQSRNSWLVMHVVHVVRRCGCRADAFDGEIDLNRTGLLEHQRTLERLALLDRLLEPRHHDVNRLRLELDRLAWLDHDTGRNRTHPHDAL